MSEAKFGEAFIKHELDEAIAIQSTIVEAGKPLSRVHPDAASRAAIKSCTKDDEGFLKQLKQLGKRHGATGEVEEVAGR